MDGDAYGGSGDLAGSMGEGSFGSAGGDYGYSSGVQEGMAPASLADLAAAVQGMSLADKASVDLAGISGREHSPGLSYADLAALEQAGLGKMDIPGFSQNVEQALAAQNVNNILGYAAPAIAGMVPGYGAISTIGRVGAGLLSGTMTLGQALSAGLAGALGAKTGLPSGIFEGVFSGDLGKAAGAGAQGGLGALVSGLTGNPYAGALAGAAFGPAVNNAVSSAVGGEKSSSGGLAGAFDRGLGTTSYNGLFGGAAPSTSTAPTGNAYGDTGASNATEALLAELAPKQEEPKTPSFTQNLLAGRYGPIAQYEFGA